jgi:hypothetical protein
MTMAAMIAAAMELKQVLEASKEMQIMMMRRPAATATMLLVLQRRRRSCCLSL